MSIFGDYKLNTLQQTAVIAFVILVCFMAGQFINSAVAAQLAPDIFKDISTLKPSDIEKINTIKILQLISSVFSFVIPSILVALLFSSKNWLEFLSLKKHPGILSFILIPLYLFSIMPVMNVIISWNENISFPDSMQSLEQSFKAAEESSKNMVNVMISGTSISALIINILLVGLLPAVGEELLFRGVIQKHLARMFKNPHLAIFISAFLFSAVHFQFYGFIPRLMLGMIFGYLVYYSGSMWTAIFAHFFNNSMAVIAIFLQNSGKITENPDNLGTQKGDIVFVIISLFLSILTAILLLRYFKKGQRESAI
jgi:membrane protease YdiL (CAAX protease family)